MTGGRTTWYATDAAEHDRELVVELGEEFGPAGPYTLRVLKDLAQQQRAEGGVRTGFRSLSRKTFCEVDEARKVIETAARIGALDDLEVDEDGRRFTCRISGWEADQARGKTAFKKAAQRARVDADLDGTEGDEVTRTGADVTAEGDMSPSGSPTIHNQRTSTPLSSELDERVVVRDLFGYWQEKCGHDQARLTRDRAAKIKARLHEGYTSAQIRQAIDGAAQAPFVNDLGKRFDDLELICRNGSKLEDFISRSEPNGQPVSSRSESAALAASYRQDTNGTTE